MSITMIVPQSAVGTSDVEFTSATSAQSVILLQEDIARWARIVKPSGATVG